MRKFFPTAIITALVLLVGACVNGLSPQSEAESLVDKAHWSLEKFKQGPEEPDAEFRKALVNARGLVIFPSAFKGAFLVGAEGGSGILIVRDENGEWSYPAFYTMGAGSFGFQAGAVASETILVLRNDKAVQAVVYNQGKLGADMGLTLGTIGGGLEGSTTTNVGADIIGFSHGAGAYAGFSLEGAAIVRRKDLNESYYGVGATPAGIVFQRKYMNAHAETLRNALVM
ncbi:MAG: lipid-binding SYLF domain-containing protein [Rhodospirillales bacterium]|nr:lipid-binding SYLF domain-containing protein [Rhodospirillales bacterium]